MNDLNKKSSDTLCHYKCREMITVRGGWSFSNGNSDAMYVSGSGSLRLTWINGC